MLNAPRREIKHPKGRVDMQSDIEIAQAAQPQRIDAIAEKAGIDDKYLEM